MTAMRNAMPRAATPIEIVDRRTGETWTHVHAKTFQGGWSMRVRNNVTKQETERVNRSPKFALYDALVACGCPRDEATKAARHFSAW
jgi:hypothetical protein